MNNFGMFNQFAALWNRISLTFRRFYFFLQRTPGLRWLSTILDYIGLGLRLSWRFGKWCGRLIWRFCRWLCRVYPRILRGCIRFIFGYSLLIYLCGSSDFTTNLPLLEDLLQNSEWLYDIASAFVDINISILRKMFENFCATPIEECNPIIGPILSDIINDSKPFIDKIIQFIS